MDFEDIGFTYLGPVDGHNIEKLESILKLSKEIEELNNQEQQIVVLRYFKGKTQTEVAKKLGISQVQVSRIEKRILLNMKQKLVG